MTTNNEKISELLNAVADVLEAEEAKLSASKDPVDIAKEIVYQGMDHPAMRALSEELMGIEAYLTKIEKMTRNMQRVGGGHIHLPGLLLKELVPLVEDLEKEAKAISRQLKQRLK